jgi:hypothetical protein
VTPPVTVILVVNSPKVRRVWLEQSSIVGTEILLGVGGVVVSCKRIRTFTGVQRFESEVTELGPG